MESALLSIASYPWNWSTWTVLGECLGDGEEVGDTIVVGCSPNHTDSCHQYCLCCLFRRRTHWYKCSKSKPSISSTAPRITNWVYAIDCWAKNCSREVCGSCLYALGFSTTCTVRYVLAPGTLSMFLMLGVSQISKRPPASSRRFFLSIPTA